MFLRYKLPRALAAVTAVLFMTADSVLVPWN